MRFFHQLRLVGPLVAIPHATITRILGQDHDNERGDLGLDLVWNDRLRPGLEWNVNEDLRYHPLTVRVGVVSRR